jgi:S1-C subfamily serine protease
MEAVGVRVMAVTPGQPAHLAGIEQNDLIVAVGDRPVRKTSDLIAAIALGRAGNTVTVSLHRNGNCLCRTISLTVCPLSLVGF